MRKADINQAITQQRLWDIRATAHYLGVAEQTVRKWVFEQRIPSVKIGGRRMFDPLAIDLWIERGVCNPGGADEASASHRRLPSNEASVNDD